MVMAEPVAISVVIPVYNEVKTIGQVIQRVIDCGYETEVVVVDDASSDGTREILQQLENPKVRCYYHAANRGKGAALRMGFAAAKYEFVIVQDPDLEYDPRDFRLVMEPLIDGRADMVYGSRFLGGPHRVLLFWHYIGNRFLTLISNMVTDLNLSDVWTCYKAFKAEVLAGIQIEEDRFGFEQEITIKIAKNR